MTAPPSDVIQLVRVTAKRSPCLSKRGAVIYDAADGRIHSYGFNDKPPGFRCSKTARCKATCGQTAVHAEQAALLMATFPAGCDVVHAKVVGNEIVPSGPPSCVECSKLMLAAGITGVWLFHEKSWHRYPAHEFHRLSLKFRA